MVRHLASGTAAWCVVVALGATAAANDPSPATVAEFTRRVQPLLLNACAAGACHGGPDAPAPRLERVPSRSGTSRRLTLANLDAFLAVVGPQRDPQSLVTLLAGGHPAATPARAFAARPLSSEQRATLETWLALVRRDDARARSDAAVRLAAGTEPPHGSPSPNRLRALLDAASQPETLPPPERPRGLIFGPVDPPEEPTEDR